jgi:hypothetical protein
VKAGLRTLAWVVADRGCKDGQGRGGRGSRDYLECRCAFQGAKKVPQFILYKELPTSCQEVKALFIFYFLFFSIFIFIFIFFKRGQMVEASICKQE